MLGAALAVLVVAGCESDQPWEDPGPKDVFDAFLMHYFRGEEREAFEYILPRDREKLLEPLGEAGDMPPEARPQAHEMLVVADVHNVYDISRMELESPLETVNEGQSVNLILHLQDGTKSNATLVWSGGRWYVDLPLDAPRPPDGGAKTGKEG